jgi:hypothetical protein
MRSDGRFSQFRRHRMRAYYLPFAAGALLAVSAFLPWVMHGQVAIGGVPSMSAIWILALGVAAMVLATLSVITRKNSRHPLLVVGLLALGIEFLALQWMQRSVAEQAWVASQATAIVEGSEAVEPAATTVGVGIYLGLAAASVIVVFGLTIVVKRVSTPYAAPEDDV